MSSELINLPQLLAHMHINDGSVDFIVAEDWLQGRTTFGGLLGIQAVIATRELLGRSWPAEWELRALQANFVGPIGPGKVTMEVHPLREGRNVKQIQVTARQDGQIGAVFICVFGVARETALPELMPNRPPIEKLPEDLNNIIYFRGISPTFTQHVELRWAGGAVAYTGGSTWHSNLYMRLRPVEHPATIRYMNELLTIMLADAAPTPAVGRISGYCPASSVSWTLELRVPSQPVNPEAWWRLDKDTAAAAQGYVNERATLWTPDGEVAAFGYQVVGVYA
jgi:acyl-CoA thioesterase